MYKLRIIYAGLLVILGILVVFTIFRPMATGAEYSNVARWHVLETENGYIVEIDIINHEGEDEKYTIETMIDGKFFSEDAVILDGEIFTYIHHIRHGELTEGNVSFVITKDGESTHLQKVTYHLN